MSDATTRQALLRTVVLLAVGGVLLLEVPRTVREAPTVVVDAGNGGSG